jgi:hypothetical protein
MNHRRTASVMLAYQHDNHDKTTTKINTARRIQQEYIAAITKARLSARINFSLRLHIFPSRLDSAITHFYFDSTIK